jgi:ppGpp synthetase/RelA/SpoT-type nucleotidyltranferase
MAHNSASDAVQEFLKDFQKEQMYWESLAHTTQKICQEKLGIQGIMARFAVRVKTYESLKKKVERCNASRGGYNSKKEIHDDICDRAGVRIVVHAPIQKQTVDIIIRETFEVVKVVQHPVEKAIHRGHIGVGYLSRDYKPVFPGYSGTHYHVQPRQEDKAMYGTNYTAGDIIEIQVSSTFLSSWQEVDHVIRYKPLAGSPSLTKYRILDSINGAAQALDILMDEVHAVNEGFQDEVGLAAFLDTWPSQLPRKRNFGNAPEVALLKLLKIYKMHNPVDLQAELENMHLQEGADIRAKLMVRKFEPFEWGVSIHIMDHLLSTKGEEVSAAKEAEERYGEDGYKIRVMLSVIMWLDEFFLPALRWEETLSRHDRTPEQDIALNWFMNGTNRFMSILLGRKARLLDEDKTKVDILWAWFEGHQEEVVRFVWRLAKMGVLKDFPEGLLQFNRIWRSVTILFSFQGLRIGTS